MLHLAGAEIDHVEMSLWKKVLDTLIDPNLIVLFLSIGTLGIIVELWNPGLIFPGTVGAISLILGLFGLQVLPISVAGLLLMMLAFAFFAAEAFIPSHGALTLAGSCLFVLGSLLLFDPAGESYEVSLTVVLAIAGTLASRWRSSPRRSCRCAGGAGHRQDEMLGQVGIVRQTLDPSGPSSCTERSGRRRATAARSRPGPGTGRQMWTGSSTLEGRAGRSGALDLRTQ